MAQTFSDLKGKTIYHIEANRTDVTIITDDRECYSLTNTEDTSNDVEVYIESVVGDFSDLIGYKLLLAEESSNIPEGSDLSPGFTWTFYKLATIKGYVDIRFCGTSNGYYSEKAEFYSAGKVDQEYFDKLKAEAKDKKYKKLL